MHNLFSIANVIFLRYIKQMLDLCMVILTNSNYDLHLVVWSDITTVFFFFFFFFK